MVDGWGGDSTPAGGTDGVRPGGWGDRRRSGWQRRPGRPPVATGTQPKPTASTGGDRWPWENVRACGRLGDARTLRKRVESQPRALAERRFSGGSKGGGALPLASPPRSTWRGLAYNPKSVSQPLGGAAEHASPGIAPEQPRPGRRGQAPRPPRRPPQGRGGRPVRLPDSSGLRRALPSARFSSCPYPSETRDRALEAILRPVDHPKSP